MSSSVNDTKFLQAVLVGNYHAAKAAVEAGASPNGPPGAPLPPILAATAGNHVSLVNYILQQGADPDIPITTGVASPMIGASSGSGARALHIAAASGYIQIVRSLLRRGRADPNATNGKGSTPLMLSFTCPDACVEVVRLLLEAGADPAFAKEDGVTALLLACFHGKVDVVDMLLFRAPATLNYCAPDGLTPLYAACRKGQEIIVSKLLALGAIQPETTQGVALCPLAAAVGNGFVSVVRVLINEGGMRAVRGEVALRNACFIAVFNRRALILRLLLTAEGRYRRSEWANIRSEGKYLIHLGASLCHRATVSILLEAGADEAARDSGGRIPREVIGDSLGREVQRTWPEEVAIRRMLQRGPAYRARSWAWPCDQEADACGTGVGDTSTVLSLPQTAKPTPDGGVLFFSPTDSSSRNCFVRVIGR